MQPGGRVQLNLGLSPATNGSLPQMSFQLKAMMDEPTTTVSQEQITVFYDGRVYVFDIVELQGNDIVCYSRNGRRGHIREVLRGSNVPCIAITSVWNFRWIREEISSGISAEQKDDLIKLANGARQQIDQELANKLKGWTYSEISGNS